MNFNASHKVETKCFYFLQYVKKVVNSSVDYRRVDSVLRAREKGGREGK